MAAPTLVARTTPTDYMMDNGFSSYFAFSRKPGFTIKETSCTPPGWDGGDPIPTTTMYNARVMTVSPQRLAKNTDVVGKASYSPRALIEARELINQEGSITQYFPDGSTYTFYGYLQKFQPGPLENGVKPEVDFTIVVTNQDPTTGAEELGVLVDVTGT